MMKFTFCVVLLSISYVGTNSEFIPVLLWQPGEVDGKISSPPSLSKVTVEQFSDYFSKQIGDRKHIVVFMEENLSLEDFGGLGSSFSSLKNITSSSSVSFLPSVQSPYKALKTLGLKMKVVNAKDFDYIFPSGDRSILVFKLEDARSEEDSLDYLNRHDNIIGEVYNSLVNKYEDILAVYTGYHSSWLESYLKPNVRKVRQLLDARDENNATYWHKDNTLLYSKLTPVYQKGSDQIYITGNIGVSVDASGAVTLTVTSDTGGPLTKLLFTKSRGYWNFDKIEVGDMTLLPKVPITAPLHFSYHCTPDVVFAKDKEATVTFHGLQVEPYADSVDTFNVAYDCVPFFSAPIWSGIFIIAMLAIVMIWALTMIMDIRTMDQFDNPKGKTIIVNATD